MAELLRDRYGDIEVTLIESGGGAFEVRADDKLIFSKLRTGRFPDEQEILALLDG